MTHSRKRDEAREQGEPWRKLYPTPEWAQARAAVRRRSLGYCEVVEHGRRCTRTAVECHHRTKLRTLWERTGERWAIFVAWACDLSELLDVCREHHEILEPQA